MNEANDVNHVRRLTARVIAEIRYLGFTEAAEMLALELEDRKRRQDWDGFRDHVERIDTLCRTRWLAAHSKVEP